MNALVLHSTPMADPAPLLLPKSSSPTAHHDASKEPAKAPSVDDALENYIGGNSLSQLLQAFFISFAWAFDAQQTFINVFTDADPAWHCISPDDETCSSAPSPCGLPPGSWDWTRPKHSSVLSEWDLQCSNTAVVGMPASAYFAGCLAGGFFLATLADSVLGRKKMLFLSCLTMSLTAALTVVSPNLWAYAALRFLCGCARATVGTSSLVLSTEIVGKKWRERVSIAGFFCFTLGFLSLPVIAYVNQDASWRTLYLWTSVPSFFYSILLCFSIQESPRWLLVRGRRDEAIETLKSIASSDCRVINSSFSKLVVAEETWNVDVFSAMKILWEKKWAFRRLAAIMVAGFGVGLVYYGMPLNVGNLGSNLYMSVAFNAMAELPSVLTTLLLVGRLNRRSSALVFTTASGVLSLLCAVMTVKAWRMAAEITSFFSACTAFNVLLIYSIELFPTSVRNSAISMLRQAIVLGGVFAPVLVVEGRKHSFVSFGVFGLVIGCCGLFTACLPETRGRNICDTMEEEEYKQMAGAAAAYGGAVA